jgi:beta-fructofuranosidase
VYGRARNSITLSWGSSTDNMGVFRYEIQRRISGSWVTVRRTTPGHRRLTVFNLRRNTAYAFRVRATDAAGNRSAVTRTLSTRTRR